MSIKDIGSEVILNMLLAAIRASRTFGINYKRVADEQAIADAEDRELDEAQRQSFIDEARAKLGDL